MVNTPVGPRSILRTARREGVLDDDRQSIAEGIRFAMIFVPGKVDVMDRSLGKNGDLAEIDHGIMCLSAGGAFGQGEIANVLIGAVFAGVLETHIQRMGIGQLEHPSQSVRAV